MRGPDQLFRIAPRLTFKTSIKSIGLIFKRTAFCRNVAFPLFNIAFPVCCTVLMNGHINPPVCDTYLISIVTDPEFAAKGPLIQGVKNGRTQWPARAD